MAIEEEDKPYSYRESGFQRIDNIISWCEKYGLKCILDLHNPLGRRFGGDSRLWKEEGYRERLIKVWDKLSLRVKDRGAIAYDLFNEPEPPENNYFIWNDLAKRLIETIRKNDKIHPIIVESINYATTDDISKLEDFEDNIVYSFHFYSPSKFTMQKVPWFKNEEETEYPGIIDGEEWNIKTIEEKLSNAIKVSQERKVPLFCGEFSCADTAPLMDGLMYLADLLKVFSENRISWAYYNYLYRTINEYWKDRFNWNLFIYYIPEKRLNSFTHKVNILKFFASEALGEVLSIAKERADNINIYGVKSIDDKVELLIWNENSEDIFIQLLFANISPNLKANVLFMNNAYGQFNFWESASLSDNRLLLEIPGKTFMKIEIPIKDYSLIF